MRIKINGVIKLNENIYLKRLSAIDQMVKKDKIQVEHYDGAPYPNHYSTNGIHLMDGVHVNQNQRNECKDMVKSIGNDLDLMIEENDYLYHKEKWCHKLGKLKMFYSRTVSSFWTIGKYLMEEKACIICEDESCNLHAQYV